MKAKEWGHIFAGLFLGAIIGVAIDIIIPIYDGAAEVLNCFVEPICSCSFPRAKGISMNAFMFIPIITAGIGLLIGLFIALSKRSERVGIMNDQKYSQNYIEIIKEINKTIEKAAVSTRNLHNQINSVSYKEDTLKGEYDKISGKCLVAQNKAEYYLNEFKIDDTEK